MKGNTERTHLSRCIPPRAGPGSAAGLLPKDRDRTQLGLSGWPHEQPCIRPTSLSASGDTLPALLFQALPILVGNAGFPGLCKEWLNFMLFCQNTEMDNLEVQFLRVYSVIKLISHLVGGQQFHFLKKFIFNICIVF